MKHALNRRIARNLRNFGVTPRALLLTAGLMALQTGLGSAPVRAQENGANAAAGGQPPGTTGEIVVSGYRFLDQDTSGTTNLPLPIEKVPQTINLVNNDFIKAADLQNLGEIAQYTPGAVNSGAPGNFVSNIYLRGFQAGYAIDGLTIIHLDYEPDPAIVDRLEVVQGPSSVVYGAASPGGLINLSLKSARPGTPSYIEASGGSWGNYRVEGQLAGALNTAGTIRAIGVAVYQHSDSFIDYVNSKRIVAYGGLDMDLADNVTAYVRASFEDYRRISFDGIPTYEDGTVVSLPRSYFLGGKDQYETTHTYRVSAGVTWQASPVWSITLKGLYEEENTSGAESYADTNISANGDFDFSNEHDVTYPIRDIGVDLSSVYKLDDVGLQGSFISASVIYQSQRKHETSTFSDLYPANVFDGDKAVTEAISAVPFSDDGFDTHTDIKYVTVSTQAVVRIGKMLTVIGGISDSINPSIKNAAGDTPVGPETSYDPGSQISYRAAIIAEPTPGLNVYGSYSESFQPQTYLDPTNTLLPPLSGKQYEVGIKYATFGHKLLLTGALFQIEETNVAEAAPIVSAITYYEATGKQRNRGVELQAIGNITRSWQINAGFTYLDPKLIEDDDPTKVGQTVTFIPKKTASIYTSYTLAEGVLAGAFASFGFRHVDSVKTSYGATAPLPHYDLVDASIGYSFDKWRLQLSVKNILNERYTLSGYQNIYYGNVTGEPRRFTVLIRREI